MREFRPYGSVRGARGDARPYRDKRKIAATLSELIIGFMSAIEEPLALWPSGPLK
jgi:hypothetical protein